MLAPDLSIERRSRVRSGRSAWTVPREREERHAAVKRARIDDPQPLTDRGVKIAKLRRSIQNAAFLLEREVERQDACRYRDWDALVSVVINSFDPLVLL